MKNAKVATAVSRRLDVEGLKNVLYCSYVDSVRTALVFALVGGSLSGLLGAYFQMWSWQSAANFVLAVTFGGLCITEYLLIPEGKEYFFPEELECSLPRVASTLGGVIQLVVGLVLVVLVVFVTFFGCWSGPIGFLGWTLLKVGVIAFFRVVLRRSISF